MAINAIRALLKALHYPEVDHYAKKSIIKILQRPNPAGQASASEAIEAVIAELDGPAKRRCCSDSSGTVW